jgi:hypothetical protein
MVFGTACCVVRIIFEREEVCGRDPGEGLTRIINQTNKLVKPWPGAEGGKSGHPPAPAPLLSAPSPQATSNTSFPPLSLSCFFFTFLFSVSCRKPLLVQRMRNRKGSVSGRGHSGDEAHDRDPACGADRSCKHTKGTPGSLCRRCQ